MLTVTNEFGCQTTAEIELVVIDAVCGKNNNKVLVCHNGNTICISPNAVPAHLANHPDDYLGPCTSKTGIAGGGVSLGVYPNPTTGLINVEFELLTKSDLNLEVLTSGGQVVYAEQLSENEGHYIHSLDLSNLASGVYMIRLSSELNVEMQRIQIQK